MNNPFKKKTTEINILEMDMDEFVQKNPVMYLINQPLFYEEDIMLTYNPETKRYEFEQIYIHPVYDNQGLNNKNIQSNLKLSLPPQAYWVHSSIFITKDKYIERDIAEYKKKRIDEILNEFQKKLENVRI